MNMLFVDENVMYYLDILLTFSQNLHWCFFFIIDFFPFFTLIIQCDKILATLGNSLVSKIKKLVEEGSTYKVENILVGGSDKYITLLLLLLLLLLLSFSQHLLLQFIRIIFQHYNIKYHIIHVHRTGVGLVQLNLKSVRN